MNITTLPRAAMLFLLLVSISTAAAAQSPSAYRIDMTISRNGSLVGKPAIVAEPGAQAEVTDQKAGKPDDGFRILVKVSPLAEAPGGKESIRLDLTFFGRLNGKWNQRASHSITALVGKNVSFAFPSKAPEAAGKNYELVLTTSHLNSAAKQAK